MGFEISGMEATIAELERWSREHDERAARAVKKGAEFTAELLQRNVPVRFGHLQKSIKAGPVKYTTTDGYYATIRPEGNDPVTGEPLAKIGNIVEYGHGKVPAIPWMRGTLEMVGDNVTDVMRQEFEGEG